jgi:hypothetical protein
MTIETKTIPIGEQEQITLTAPGKDILALRRVGKDAVRIYRVSEKDLLKLLGEDAPVELPDDVVSFCLDQDLVGYVEAAVRTVRAVFAGADPVTVSLKRDEYGDSYVDVHAVVPDNPEAEAEKYSACVEKWAAFIPPHFGGKIHLSTSFEFGLTLGVT